MKFIFPQNYNFKNKLFGIIDYSTAIFNIIWFALIILILNLIFSDLSIKIFLTIIFCFPLILLSFIGFNGENILYVFLYMFKFIFKQKLYLFYKRSSKPGLIDRN